MECISVIGLGSIAKRHRKNLKEMFPAAKVLAMSASGRKLKNPVENADEVVTDTLSIISTKPDFVIVASPSTYHAEHALPLLEAGIPVLIEKPVTASSSDAEKLSMIEFGSDLPPIVAVGYCLRYLSSSIRIKELLNQKIIGSVYNVSTNIGQFLPQWRESKDYMNSVSAKKFLGGGALLELSHELDYLQWLLGDLNYNYAILRNSSELSLNVEEVADLLLTSDSGTLCYVHMDFLQKKAQRTNSFIGSKGRLDWDVLKNSITLYTEDKVEVIYEEPSWDKNQMYIEMVKDFVSSINGFENQCVSLSESSKTVALIETIKERCHWGVTQ